MLVLSGPVSTRLYTTEIQPRGRQPLSSSTVVLAGGIILCGFIQGVPATRMRPFGHHHARSTQADLIVDALGDVPWHGNSL